MDNIRSNTKGFRKSKKVLDILKNKDKDKPKLSLQAINSVGNIDNKIEDKELREIAKKYSEKFLNKELNDVETIYNFLNHINNKNYFWEGNEISLVWNHDGHRDIPWEEGLAFDVFYNHQIKDREYRVTIEFIEWLNKIKNKKIITDELLDVSHKITEHIDFLKSSQETPKIENNNFTYSPSVLRKIEEKYNLDDGELDWYFTNS